MGLAACVLVCVCVHDWDHNVCGCMRLAVCVWMDVWMYLIVSVYDCASEHMGVTDYVNACG